MKKQNQNKNKMLASKAGMTLVELLVSISLLTLIIFCFMPLFMSYYKNIKTSGAVVKNNYTKVGLIEKLVGNTGSNSGYEYEVNGIPLTMTVEEKSGNIMQVKSSETGEDIAAGVGSQIQGNNIISTPDSPSGGFTTFYANSVTSSMLCFPSHISDDFKEKDITLYAVGFKFNNINEFKLTYTKEDGTEATVDKNYYTISQSVNTPNAVTLTLRGDNDQINFRTSPLTIRYANRPDALVIEIDAPNIVMVGEATSDGDYYYYVSSGEENDDGTLDIVAKTMNNTDSLGKVTLDSAMNDVEWISAEEGDGKNVATITDPKTGKTTTQKYGYYAMCGDNGQIRRFWKDSTGKYFWGGDNTIDYSYSKIINKDLGYNSDGSAIKATTQANVTSTPMYSHTASYKYVSIAYPYISTDHSNISKRNSDSIYNGNRTDGILVDDDNMQKLYTNTVFTLNAIDDPNVKFWATKNNLTYSYENINSEEPWSSDNMDTMYNRYIIDNGRAYRGLEVYGQSGTTESVDRVPIAKATDITSVSNSKMEDKFTVRTVAAEDVGTSYGDFWGNDDNSGIVLTSVDTVKMNNTYTKSGDNPINSYTLYCGYIPAVVDLWSPTRTLNSDAGLNYTRWLATLGVGYVENDADLLDNYPLIRSHYYIHKVMWWNENKFARLGANIWRYAESTNDSYALTGICGPANYANSKSIKEATELVNKQRTDGNAYGIKDSSQVDVIYPLNTTFCQSQLQQQNTTQISIGYLSNPRAMGGLYNEENANDVSPNRADHANVYQWTFDKGTTFLDSDSVTLEDESGNQRSISIAVGYTLAGLENGYDGGVIVPTVMNNGVVYIRAGGANQEEPNSGYLLDSESNIFHMFYYTSDYATDRGSDKLFDNAVSMKYWRDAYHPLYYSTYGKQYDSSKYPDSYIFSHVLNDKKLNCVSWGTRWDGGVEAMWGASDGTLMGWGDIINHNYYYAQKNPGKYADSLNTRSANCEFQSYKWLDVGIAQKTLYYKYKSVGITYDGTFRLPNGIAQNMQWIKENGNNAPVENGYLDARSLYLYENNNKYDPIAYGFVSPLDTIEDVEYGDNIWVAVGCQGQNNPQYCGSLAVERAIGSGKGSWVAVRSWFDKSGGVDSGPCMQSNAPEGYPQGSSSGEDNNFFLWHAVQISTTENCNIVQVTNTGGKWYAVGYIDTNANDQCDTGEKAVVFYATDPTLACGKEGGWKLATSSVDGASKSYTQACHFNGSTWSTVDIASINSMASRDD